MLRFNYVFYSNYKSLSHQIEFRRSEFLHCGNDGRTIVGFCGPWACAQPMPDGKRSRGRTPPGWRWLLRPAILPMLWDREGRYSLFKAAPDAG
jgi:hypothetical protein